MVDKFEWFGCGSWIIIIMEDLNFLKVYGIDYIYKVDYLIDEEVF